MIEDVLIVSSKLSFVVLYNYASRRFCPAALHLPCCGPHFSSTDGTRARRSRVCGTRISNYLRVAASPATSAFSAASTPSWSGAVVWALVTPEYAHILRGWRLESMKENGNASEMSGQQQQQRRACWVQLVQGRRELPRVGGRHFVISPTDSSSPRVLSLSVKNSSHSECCVGADTGPFLAGTRE